MMNLEKYGATRIPKFDRKEFEYFDFHHNQYLGFLRNDSKILEIGPGNGSFSLYVQSLCGTPSENVTLIDLSKSTVDLLRSQKETEKCDIVLSDVIEHLSKISDASVDFIVARHILEHMERDYLGRLIPQFDRILRKGGKILVEVPNLSNYPLGVNVAFGDFSHVTFFTHETLVEAFVWNFDSEFKMTVHDMKPTFHFSWNPVRLSLECLSYAIKKSSIIVSRILVGRNNRFGAGVAVTPFMIGILTKQ